MAAVATVFLFGSLVGCYCTWYNDLLEMMRWQHLGATSNYGEAYNDRRGRVIDPHRDWVDHSERWRSPYAELHVFSAFYQASVDFPTEPRVQVMALASPKLRHNCNVRARVVFKDYPHSFPTRTGTCRFLSSARKRDADSLEAVVLEFETGESSRRVPVSITILLNGKNSQIWLPVRAIADNVEATRRKVGICLRSTGRASPFNLIEFVAFHRLIGVTNFIVYADVTADDKPEFVLWDNASRNGLSRDNVLPWYKGVVLKNASTFGTKILLEDCLRRSASSVEFVALMNADEFLVPRVKNSSTTHGRLLADALSAVVSDVYYFERASFCDDGNAVRGRRRRFGDSLRMEPPQLLVQTKLRNLEDFAWHSLVFRCRIFDTASTGAPSSSSTSWISRENFVLHKFEGKSKCDRGNGRLDKAARFFERDLLDAKDIVHFYGSLS